MTPAEVTAPPGLWCAIPVYDNGETVAAVARACRQRVPHVVVVDDGSTDVRVAELLAETDITVLRHESRRGKGAALRTALDHAASQGATWLITLDADGQHSPEDIPSFFPHLRAAPDALLLGSRDLRIAHAPRSSRFGRAFSNFWVFLETGLLLSDTQTGFRAYPVRLARQLPCACRHFDFEIEILVRFAWAGLPIRSVPVTVSYPRPSERISHFHKWRDNARLSRLHARLVLRRLFALPTRAFFRVLRERAHAPAAPAMASAAGVLLGALPTPGFHTPLILAVTRRLGLDAAMALAARNISVPPLVPVISIEIGHRLLRGRFLVQIGFQEIVIQAGSRWIEWLLGSLLVGPILATAVALLVHRWRPKKATETDRAPTEGSRRISARRRGNRLGYWFFKTALRLTGLRGAYGLLYLVCLHYLLFDREAVASALAYLERRFPGRARLHLLFSAYRLFINQGRCLVDRYACLAGLPFDIRFPTEDRFLALGSRGFVLLLAHVGNWQLALTALGRVGRPVCLLMRPEDNPAVAESLRVSSEGSGVRIVSPESPFGGILELMKHLAEGCIVCVMGDRSYRFQAAPVTFLGAPAWFPSGAFRIAAGAECPVVFLFARRAGYRRYDLDVPEVCWPVRLEGQDRQQQLNAWTQSFATAVEAFARQNPYQVFLFRDVWTPPGGIDEHPEKG